MADYLCPVLYRRLEARFGSVLIANEGEEAIVKDKPALTERKMVQGESKSKRELLYRGETYRVCCPKCKDTRHRLYIPHRVVEFPNQIRCFNEGCYASYENREQLLFYIFKTRKPSKLPVLRGKTDNAVLGEVEMPGKVAPLSDLPHDHPANDYLYSRGYDPWELSRIYGIGYCEHSSLYPAVSERIVVPLRMRGMMVGWQARYVGDINWKATGIQKYWNRPGMPTRLILYNHDQAALQPFTILQEGITDVWSTGPMAMGLLTKSISFTKRRILDFPPFRDKPVGVMLDGDAAEENRATTDDLRQTHPGGVFTVELPDGVDPGKLAPEVNMELIRSAAAAQGIKLGDAPV